MSARALASAGIAAPIAVGGSLLAADDFSTDAPGSAPGGWSTLSGTPTVCAGAANARQLCLPAGDVDATTTGSADWTDYRIDTVVTVGNTSAGGVGLLGRVQPDGKFYEMEVRPEVGGTGRLWWYIWNFDGGKWNLVAGKALAAPPGPTFALRFDLRGSQLSAYMGSSVATLAPLGGGTDASYASGAVGVRNFGGLTAAFGPVRVTGVAGGAAVVDPTSGTDGGSLQAETPRSAGAFVAGAGVNMHTGDFNSAYNANVPLLETLTRNLGVKLIRDGMSPDQPSVCAENARFGAAGIKLSVTMDPSTGISDLQRWSACVGSGVISSVEGWNEYDLTHPAGEGGWPGTLQNAQRALYADVKSKFGGVPVIAPVVTTSAAASAIGNLAPYADFGNAHVYYGAHYPENGGYGSNDYGSIGYVLGFAGGPTGSKPIAVTETGFGTDIGGGYVSEAVQAKYMVRNLLAIANAGVSKIMIYEMIDDGSAPFAKYGLLHADLSTKPSYNALKGLLSVLSDSASGAPGTPLSYALGGSTTNLRHALFQKSDGTYALALWLGVPSSDPNSGADIGVAPQPISVALGRSIAPTLASFDATGNLRTQTLPTGSTVSLEATDQVQILTFR